mmetsp:Transcript_21841/g.50317  ORF Transcript_21841/g.50317 Transcript_21841/m.50317 type:complete len:205 (-) Transcript_21841:65-679(-)
MMRAISTLPPVTPSPSTEVTQCMALISRTSSLGMASSDILQSPVSVDFMAKVTSSMVSSCDPSKSYALSTNSSLSRVDMAEQVAVAAKNSRASTRSFWSVSSSLNAALVFSFILVRFTFNSSSSSAQISSISYCEMPKPSATSLNASHRRSSAEKLRFVNGVASSTNAALPFFCPISLQFRRQRCHHRSNRCELTASHSNGRPL